MRAVMHAAFVGWASGCAAAPELAAIEQLIVECPPSVCGVNSPEIGSRGFHELSRSGAPNREGFRILQLEKDGSPYTLAVTGGRLTGDHPALGRIEGQALVGARIWIDRAGERSVIRVAGVGATTFPVGAPDPVETYILEYAMVVKGVPSGAWTNLCDGHTIATGDPDLDEFEALGMAPQESILFEGDRIDLATKTLNATPDPDWFNIGCTGHTLAKLHLTRNTIASTGIAEEAFAARQATLKLLTADYCGTGVPFTVAGQKLVWRGGEVDYVKPPRLLEARWDEHGAVCLAKPRMASPSTADGAIRFPDIEAAIAAECPRPPPCADADPWELAGALRVSSNP